MKEQKRIKKQLYKNMLYIYIVFIILFLLFDLIIYNKISNSMYKNIDEQLNIQVERYGKEPPDIRNRNDEHMVHIENDENISNEENINNQEIREIKNPRFQDVDPRLICIIRNENGEVINQSSLGRVYNNYLTNIEFDKSNIKNTYMLKVDNQYNYRGITIINYNENNELNYIQFLANVDSEMQALNNLSITLIIGTSIIIIISVLASYFLSRRALNPIMVSWRKQTEFVQNASHELRTPLTIIQTKQELLLQEPNAKVIEKSQDINIALNETRRLSKLIKDLMILARSDSNEVVLDKKKVEIDKLIENISIPYTEFAEIEEKNVIMDLKFGQTLNVDESKISQLIVILLDNAIKYTRSGDSIKIKTYNKDNKFVLEVVDTGIGISKEGIEHAFDRFYREDKARSRERGGSGLGLSIAYMITELHGGSIKIMQNQPKGTKIIVRL